MKLRINPLVVADLKVIQDYIAEDNAEAARKIIDEIYKSFENLHQFCSHPPLIFCSSSSRGLIPLRASTASTQEAPSAAASFTESGREYPLSMAVRKAAMLVSPAPVAETTFEGL